MGIADEASLAPLLPGDSKATLARTRSEERFVDYKPVPDGWASIGRRCLDHNKDHASGRVRIEHSFRWGGLINQWRCVGAKPNGGPRPGPRKFIITLNNHSADIRNIVETEIRKTAAAPDNKQTVLAEKLNIIIFQPLVQVANHLESAPIKDKVHDLAIMKLEGNRHIVPSYGYGDTGNGNWPNIEVICATVSLWVLLKRPKVPEI
ncbi:hypothetical protein C0989_001549 [Termitomyces sp. Mn162]|nr:hypothetical protein C0989_001549 [Termitomyces sp. Mn162]